MAQVEVYNFEGEVKETMELPASIFEVKLKNGLVHNVVVGLQANERQVLAHTKTRGEIRGGGKKPWKQKGTGRARVGSIRSPLWRGGGIIFGPRNIRNFKVKINKKTKQLALKMVLSQKVAEQALILLENFDLEQPKTKKFVDILKKLPLIGKKILIIFPVEKKNFRLASQNIPNIKQINLCELNILDLLKTDTVITTKETIEFWNKIYQK